MRKLLNILVFAVLMMLRTTSWAQGFAGNSVLKDGTIYKIGVVTDGVYRITFDELAAKGVDVNALNTNKISLFGNINGMLPEDNGAAAYDDLTEMDIIVDDSGIMFYGQGAYTWKNNGNFFKYQTNYYSDTTFYFLKIDNQNDGKRMGAQPQDDGDYQNVVTSFVDRQYHEIDSFNNFHMGRKWYGETVNIEEGVMTIPFVFKNILTEYQGLLDVCFVGASKVDGTVARLKVDGISVVDDIKIQKSGDYSYGVEKEAKTNFNPSGDTVEVELEIVSDNTASYLGLDYVSICAWRSLRYENEQLQFTINRNSHPIVELLNIDNVGEGAVVMDVSSPLSPKIQDFSMTGNVVGFKRFLADNNSFVVFKNSDVMPVASMQLVDNQNVHSITNAEMLIITDKVFADQAEAIKTIHEEEDGLLSKVVFVDEIYNEFSSGSPDITAIRNFIKMVYQRSPNLRYVLLFGRGNNDFKNVEGYGTNFVPPYEAMNSVNQLVAYVTDDYYGLLDIDEGDECAGHVDIGVGRIPVLTTEEADVVVDKIRRYINDAKTRGQWRNEMLLLADDSKTYSKNCDEFEIMIDTMSTTVNISKIYADAYVRKKLSDGSFCYPDATASIIDIFDEGIIMMAYLGHGGVRGLSKSNLFKIKDIESLNNYYKLPFVVTGTCEFSAFDDASFVSAGEILYKMENGGAIGMYTTTRPTVANVNKIIIKEFLKNTYNNGNIKYMAMGDIVCLTKKANNNNISNYLSYVFFGDPALRFTYPAKKIVINKVNNQLANTKISVAPMDTVRVEGWVANENGAVDVAFNGVVYPKMFDNKSTYTTLNNSGDAGNYHTFSDYSDILYDGGFSVVNGRFTCVFTLPRSVNNQNGDAKISFYALDTINDIDANGFFKNISVDGEPSLSPDFEGPEIILSWNDGHLSAALHDPQGICHYNSMIGRDIVIQVETNSMSKSLVVNDYYEQIVDDYTRGNVEIDLDFLEIGDNIIDLKAWDTHGNSNSASITVNIVDDEAVKSMRNVVNYPNPFAESTCFTIDFDKNNVTVDVEIFIYDVVGRIVNTLEYNNLNVNNLKMEWDGRDASGNHLPTGLYIYKVCMKDSDGCEYSTSQRMIIL